MIFLELYSASFDRRKTSIFRERVFHRECRARSTSKPVGSSTSSITFTLKPVSTLSILRRMISHWSLTTVLSNKNVSRHGRECTDVDVNLWDKLLKGMYVFLMWAILRSNARDSLLLPFFFWLESLAWNVPHIDERTRRKFSCLPIHRTSRNNFALKYSKYRDCSLWIPFSVWPLREHLPAATWTHPRTSSFHSTLYERTRRILNILFAFSRTNGCIYIASAEC